MTGAGSKERIGLDNRLSWIQNHKGQKGDRETKGQKEGTHKEEKVPSSLCLGKAEKETDGNENLKRKGTQKESGTVEITNGARDADGYSRTEVIVGKKQQNKKKR